MKGERGKVYDNAEDFYNLEGSCVMMLTTAAAIKVCQSTADNGLVVARVEGGVWHDPGFEARLDCIWDGVDPPLNKVDAHKNDLKAAEFIASKSDNHDVFILTTPTITGWRHKK